jgi:hypothetical protein
MNVEEINNFLQTMKKDLKEIKLMKSEFEILSMDFNSGGKMVKYYDERGRELLVEYYNEATYVVKTEYDTNKEGKKDVMEYDLDGDGIPNTIEYDVDGNGKVDVIERDINRDGIIDITEMEIKINGKFLPLSSFSNIIMY